jgi:hypothetical protein
VTSNTIVLSLATLGGTRKIIFLFYVSPRKVAKASQSPTVSLTNFAIVNGPYTNAVEEQGIVFVSGNLVSIFTASFC